MTHEWFAPSLNEIKMNCGYYSQTWAALCFQYILVVFAKDVDNTEVDRPLEIQVLVEDVNDNAPVCEEEESVFEVQENEPVGKKCL